MDLEGKVALVTGASTGIGLEYVKALLANGVKHVSILDIDETNGVKNVNDLNEKYGAETAIFIQTDVTKKEDFEVNFKKAVDTFKSLDIVINNAGILDDSRWELEIALNVNAVVSGTLLALQYMGKDQGGRGGVVANIASILGLAVAAGAPVYTATKHAVIGLSRSFGMPFHYDRTGVRVVTMCPGVTDTPLISEAGRRQLSNDWGKEIDHELTFLPIQNRAVAESGDREDDCIAPPRVNECMELNTTRYRAD
uniref:15-hydroxyprostaglandin dehydrogenase n=1 Tax=Timema douglasi TaxID=61478 RepID=A0A7R8VTN1_TIMDO|nr:unnamed protein product [Timema douglasi]